MFVYLHGDNAERSKCHPVHVSPGGDDFTGATPADKPDWFHPNGNPKQIELTFEYGRCEVSDDLGKYLVERGIAHKSAMLRKVRQFFTRAGKPITELFDANGERIVFEESAAA